MAIYDKSILANYHLPQLQQNLHLFTDSFILMPKYSHRKITAE
jgi:hypothetical protein